MRHTLSCEPLLILKKQSYIFPIYTVAQRKHFHSKSVGWEDNKQWWARSKTENPVGQTTNLTTSVWCWDYDLCFSWFEFVLCILVNQHQWVTPGSSSLRYSMVLLGYNCCFCSWWAENASLSDTWAGLPRVVNRLSPALMPSFLLSQCRTWGFSLTVLIFSTTDSYFVHITLFSTLTRFKLLFLFSIFLLYFLLSLAVNLGKCNKQ